MGTNLAVVQGVATASMTTGILGNSVGVVTAFLLALACEKGESGAAQASDLHQNETLPTNSSETGQVVEGCEDVFVPRAALPHCSGLACEQVLEREPDRAVQWRLTVQLFQKISETQTTDLSEEIVNHERDCLFRQLENLALAPDHYVASGIDDVVVDATFEQLESVLYTTAIDYFSLSCVEDSCKHCETLNEEDCRSDAFCTSYEARHVAPEYQCVDQRFAGCGWTDQVFNDSEPVPTPITSTDGSCWLFGGAPPPGYQAGFGTPNPACDAASSANLPQCAHP